MVSVVIAAGGRGTRMGADINKVYLKLCNKQILMHTVEAFEKNPKVGEVVIVTGTHEIEHCKELVKKYGYSKVSAITNGGDTRQQSVYNGIMMTTGDIVMIHDGARALISQEEIDNVLKDCEKYGAAAVGVKCKDTLKKADKNGFIMETIDRETTYNIQTPQVFKRDIIVNAHEAARERNINATDDCALAEHMGIQIKITEGSYNNIKLTTPEDMAVAENIITGRKNEK